MAKRQRTLYAYQYKGFAVRNSADNIADDAICNIDGQYPTSKKEYKELYSEIPTHKYIVTVTVKKVRI